MNSFPSTQMTLQQNYQNVLARIQVACKKRPYSYEKITLVAATKYASVKQLDGIIQAGITHIGENRIQDAIKKLPILHKTIKKHFIGHLQTNKVKEAVKYFDIIESIDSPHLAEAINSAAQFQNKKMPILMQVNIANDTKKFGFKISEVKEVLNHLNHLPFLKVEGFMTIVPFSENSENVRPFFRLMKESFDHYQKQYPELKTLSMGMSHDFEIAIEEGATEVRIGSLLFKE